MEEIGKALSQSDAPGRSVIPAEIALTAEERAWLNEHRAEQQKALLPGTHEAIYARLERFSFGFGQLRSLDPGAIRGVIENWCEGIEASELALLAVDRACRRWNASGFAWQKPGMVPNPDELTRAVRECDAAIRAEARSLDRVLLAKPEEPLALPPPDSTRPGSVEEAMAEYRAAIDAMSRAPTTHPERDPKPAPRFYSQAYHADMARRKARREAENAPPFASREEVAG